MRSRKLADYLDFWGVKDDCVLFGDGSVGLAFEVTGLDPSALSDDALNQLSASTTSFLNGLPSNTWIQFVRDITFAKEETLVSHLRLSNPGADPVARSLAEARVKHLSRQIPSGNLRSHSLCVLLRSSRLESKAVHSLRNLFRKDVDALTHSAVQTELDRVSRLGENLEAALTGLHLKPRRMPGREVLEMAYRQWNPDRPSGLPSYDPDDVRSSLLFSDVEIEKTGFSIGSTYHKVLSLKLLPDQTYSAMAEALGRLPFQSRVLTTIFVPDQTQEIESLQTQRRIAYSMTVGKRSGVSDLDSTAKFNDLEKLLDQMISSGEKVFQFSVNVVLKSQSEEELKTQVEETMALFREMSGAEVLEETFASFDVFSKAAFPNAKQTERMKRIKTSNLADLLPIYAPWQGQDTPRVLLKSREETMMYVDPFDQGLTNANQLISGASGAGKSFLTNMILLHMLKEKPRVFFVDIGGSYRRLCENLGGHYINLVAGSDVAINPFDLPEGDLTPSPTKIKFLVGLVELMTKEDDSRQLPRLVKAELEQAVLETYLEHPKPRLSHLREILLRNTDQNVHNLGKILGPWCGDTPFGQVIDRETTVHLNSGAVAFDLKGMESYPELQAVCLFMITDLVWREIQKDRSTMKFLVLDECWKLLKSESGLVFIEEVFRTFRKYYASAIAISQDIDDFAKSKIAGAILPNCALKWLLLQPQGDKSRLKEVLALNDNEIDLISSLSQEKGVYSEAFLMAGSHRAVTVVEATPLEHWIATTDPRDLSEIDYLKKSHPDMNLLEILETLAKKFPHGVTRPQTKEVSLEKHS